MVWIDTHCHLNAEPFSGKVPQTVELSKKNGVSHILIPSIDRDSFTDVHHIAHTVDGCSYALGIHPLYVPQSPESDLDVLEQWVQEKMMDNRFVAIGEIGLDFYLPERCTPAAREKQEYFFCRQLDIARQYDLPVLLHTLRSVDTVLKFLRQHGVKRGIAHAFNGSMQQAEAYINQGFKISFCGTVTYERAHQRRTLAKELPIDALVVETDAPDLPPYWKNKRENSPAELPRIAGIVAGLRGISPEYLAECTSHNAVSAVPRLADRI